MPGFNKTGYKDNHSGGSLSGKRLICCDIDFITTRPYEMFPGDVPATISAISSNSSIRRSMGPQHPR